jgi:thymidylate synthase (FAD)
MLRIWEQLYAENPELFADCGPFCMNGRCEEGHMSCGNLIPSTMAVTEIISNDFPKLCGKIDAADGNVRQQKGVVLENSVN